jgi:predicted metalloprotease
MNHIKLALMAAGAWWLWTTISPHIPQEEISVAPARGNTSRGRDHDGEFFAMLFGNINAEWHQILPRYREPRLVIFDQATSGCHDRASAGSPFYCPPEGAIYLSP